MSCNIPYSHNMTQNNKSRHSGGYGRLGNNTTIHEGNIPITIEHSSTQKKYFSLFHTISSCTIPVEISLP